MPKLGLNVHSTLSTTAIQFGYEDYDQLGELTGSAKNGYCVKLPRCLRWTHSSVFVGECKAAFPWFEDRPDMYRNIDILDILARTAVFHVTELVTIDFAINALSRKLRPHSVPASFFARIAKLNLTLRLPYAFCFGGSITTPKCSYHDTYFRLDSFLVQLKGLKRFRLMLDHDSHHAWARVNEMYLLDPFRKFLETKNRDLLVILPKLHPRWEDPERHFMEGNMTAFPLLRHVRQRFHAMPTRSKYWIVEFKPDFPFLLGVPQRTMQEIEDAERELMKTHGSLQYVVEREYAHMIERRRKRREELSRR
ncbi:hypothetical protein IQ07DRAFT_645098 [Pyrenochaeta sp. DS3sAY3a]|nr:hypothetical protein IQ07DRAFT_645098 [Pyrenochaeta sp. DS3sAY3a]